MDSLITTASKVRSSGLSPPRAPKVTTALFLVTPRWTSFTTFHVAGPVRVEPQMQISSAFITDNTQSFVRIIRSNILSFLI